MDSIESLKAVVSVVECGSFTAASERLNISKALVSKYVSQIEARLGVRLFNRTTRKIGLTEVGQQFYNNALEVLSAYQQMIDSAQGQQSGISGQLTISAPFTFGTLLLPDWISEFNRLHPQLKIKLKLSNKAVNMLEEGIDLRFKVGRLNDSNMIARHLKSDILGLYASSAYIKAFGAPKTLAELADHRCVVDYNFSQTDYWKLLDSQGHLHTVNLNPAFTVNDAQAAANIAANGGGIALLPRHIARDRLFKLDLVPVLSQYHAGEIGLYLLYPHREYLPVKVRRFIDFVLQKF